MVRRASGGITHDLDDAIQETLCRVLAIDAYRFDSTRPVEGFIAMRARWTLRDMRRREARRGRLDALDLARDAAPKEHPAPDVPDPLPDLTPHLASLSVADRALLIAHDIDGVSLTMLARQMGVTVSTLSRRRVAALERVAGRVNPSA
jgi:DNA-directed RNA polymerase specialized sigma24 family protein